MKKKIKKVLIANRGEIACRIIQALRETGRISVAVYSDADHKALHVKMADYSVHIGDSIPKESYLNIDKIIKAAIENDCDAIHPGYGFLSENWFFCKKVIESGLIFIGPNYNAMKLLGSKTESRELMQMNNIPLVPGFKSNSNNYYEFLEQSKIIGFPILIKAAAGGGGKGMRIVRKEEDFKQSFETAKRESLSAFGSDDVFIEKYIENPKHIEFQIVADKFGNIIHLNERECSVQRRHQKIIEESPSMALDKSLRFKMGDIAKKVCSLANYDNLGTVEFLLDNYQNFYFLEVNTRIQVEHPVTEEITGIDLVKLQLDIAEGNILPFKQEDIITQGHSIECRIYAEDGNNNFMPSSGQILFYKEPKGKGIRFDKGIYEGFEVPIYYDPILAKLIVKGFNREEARLKMIEALKNTVILGISNSIELMIKILESQEFIENEIFTNTLDLKYNNYKSDDDKFLNEALITAFTNSNHTTNNKNVIEEEFDIWKYIGNLK